MIRVFDFSECCGHLCRAASHLQTLFTNATENARDDAHVAGTKRSNVSRTPRSDNNKKRSEKRRLVVTGLSRPKLLFTKSGTAGRAVETSLCCRLVRAKKSLLESHSHAANTNKIFAPTVESGGGGSLVANCLWSLYEFNFGSV